MRISQLELLEEGFWGAFGRGIKGVATVGREIAKVATPSIYNPLKSVYDWGKHTNEELIKNTTPAFKYITDQLHMRGYMVTGDIEPIPMPKGLSKDKQTYFVLVNKMAFDPNTKKMELSQNKRDRDIPLVVDKNGGIVENLRNNPEKQYKAGLGKTITRPPKPAPQVTTGPPPVP